jgi:hypothetical protein
MKRAKLVAGMTAIIPAVTAVGLAPQAAAHASTASGVRAEQASLTGKSVALALRQAPAAVSSVWASLSHSDTFYYRSGGTLTLPRGWLVYVTCYYSGAPYADPYWDHVTKEGSKGGYETNYTGHIADRYVDLSGYPKSAGIPHC